MNSIVQGIANEFAKIKCSSYIHLTYLLPAIFCYLFYLAADGLNALDSFIVKDSFYKTFQTFIGLCVFALLPIIVALFSSVTGNIEFNNKTIALIKSQPYPLWKIFVSKSIISLALVTISIIVICTAIFAMLCLINIEGDYGLIMKISDLQILLKGVSALIYSLIPIIVIHVFIGMILSSALLNALLCCAVSYVANFNYFQSGIELKLVPHLLPLLVYSRFSENEFLGGANSIELLLIATFCIIIAFFFSFLYFSNYNGG